MDIFTVIIYGVCAFVGLFIAGFFVWFIAAFAKYREIPTKPARPRRKSFFKRLLVDFPKQYWEDRFTRNPEAFPLYGLHLITGEQGSGKTVALAAMLLDLKKQYPKLKISTNFNYIHQDSEITHWRDIVFDNNGEYGKLEVIDEIQNWFNSLQSKDFPIEMITEISQQRKQRKIIIGTSQVFNRVAKPIREQVDFLYEPLTIAGCLTIVRVSKPKKSEDGSVIKRRMSRIYFFVHSKEIRDSFDTYKKIEKMSQQGYAPRPELTGTGESLPEQSKRSGLLGKLRG